MTSGSESGSASEALPPASNMGARAWQPRRRSLEPAGAAGSAAHGAAGAWADEREGAVSDGAVVCEAAGGVESAVEVVDCVIVHISQIKSAVTVSKLPRISFWDRGCVLMCLGMQETNKKSIAFISPCSSRCGFCSKQQQFCCSTIVPCS